MILKNPVVEYYVLYPMEHRNSEHKSGVECGMLLTVLLTLKNSDFAFAMGAELQVVLLNELISLFIRYVLRFVSISCCWFNDRLNSPIRDRFSSL